MAGSYALETVNPLTDAPDQFPPFEKNIRSVLIADAPVITGKKLSTLNFLYPGILDTLNSVPVPKKYTKFEFTPCVLPTNQRGENI